MKILQGTKVQSILEENLTCPLIKRSSPEGHQVHNFSYLKKGQKCDPRIGSDTNDSQTAGRVSTMVPNKFEESDQGNQVFCGLNCGWAL